MDKQPKLCVSLVPIFNHLEYDYQKKILDLSKTVHYKKGETLYNSGDMSDKLFIIHIGKVKVYTIDELGKEHILYILTSGMYIGETSLFLNNKHTNFAEAVEDTSICVIHKDDLFELMDTHPTISQKILQEFAKRLEHSEKQSQSMATDTAEIRLMRYLDKLSTIRNNKSYVHLLMSRKNLANHLGMTPETLSRTFSKLEKNSVIKQLNNKEIIIINTDYLEAY